MGYNGAECDIYIGKGAGRMLMDDIRNAQKSVKIISPYLSASLIKELIYLKNKRIDVHLITVDCIEDFYYSDKKNIYKLIRQHRSVDEDARNKRNKWIKYSRILLFGSIFLLLALVALYMIYRDVRLCLGMIPLVLLALAYKWMMKKIDTKKIYNYTYSQLFPFKVYRSPSENWEDGTFIHSKVYLIDDAIAYMGSLNFTVKGTKDNYETRIKVKDQGAVDVIRKEFHRLFHYSDFPEVNIQNWGSRLYKEPLN